MKLISKSCLDFVKKIEGFYPNIYLDIVGVPTLGYGMTGKEIEGLKSVTESQASAMLEDLLNNKYASLIKKDLDSRKVKLKQNEFDALVSMAYNVGTGGLLSSTLYKNIVAGVRDKDIITANFQAWSNARGKRVAGLYRRRTEESEMFLKQEIASPKAQKVNYVLEYQKFYNKVTQTSKPLVEDGIYGTSTQKAMDTMNKLIRGEY